MNEFLTNPLFVRTLAVLIIALAAVLVGSFFIRRLRTVLGPEPGWSETRPTGEGGIAFQAYESLIARLKTQEQELSQLREEAANRAAASESLSAAVLANLGIGVVVLTPLGTVQQANPAAREILGYASPSGLHARDLLRGIRGLRGDSADVALLFSTIDRAASSSEPSHFEVDYCALSGEEKVLALIVSPVRSNGGAFLGCTCLISDLTQVTSLSRQMHLRENLASLGEMSAGIAHEFKNSLATISGYSQMLRSEESATVRDFAGRIHSATENLTRVVTDFLNFARPKALRWEPIELRDVLLQCAQETSADLDLAGFPLELTITGDPTALRQVFSNLLRNSVEAAKSDTPAHITVLGAAGPDFAEVVLRDNGTGIPDDILKNIFIPFVTTKPHGTGLGLALVHRIVTEHGGSVRAANTKDGATFTLSLPLRKPALAQKAAGKSPETR